MNTAEVRARMSAALLAAAQSQDDDEVGKRAAVCLNWLGQWVLTLGLDEATELRNHLDEDMRLGGPETLEGFGCDQLPFRATYAVALLALFAPLGYSLPDGFLASKEGEGQDQDREEGSG